jgi:hypothetical protein
MKQSQWIFAVAVLIVMVFAVTFAMNYLGGTPDKLPDTDGNLGPRYELAFIEKMFPPDGFGPVDRENKTLGHCDFWFQNPHDVSFKAGLIGQSCKCTEVRIFLLPSEASQKIASCATGFAGLVFSNALNGATFMQLAVPELQRGATEYEILKDKEAVDIEPKAIGWVRMLYKGEKPGAMGLKAAVWTGNKESPMLAELAVRLTFHDGMRVQPALAVGTITDNDLAAGVKRYIYCFSSTRRQLNVEAMAATIRKNNPKSDPFQVGAPEMLNLEEVLKLEKEVAGSQGDPSENAARASLLCAYRIPITLKAMSEDGTTPFDLGPFRRRVLVNCPEFHMEPRSVIVVGRVKGVIDLQSEEEGGDIQFRVFKSSRGRRVQLIITSEVSDLKLEVDHKQTSEFLKADIEPMKSADKRGTWTLHAEVIPNKAFGNFPRKDDPLFEDCAVYLKATLPGNKERVIRLSATGTATSD